MSFQISQTPTLEAVATEDEKLLARDLQARVAGIVEQVQADPDVAEARQAKLRAQEHLDRLRAAERALTQQAKEARGRMDRMEQAALGTLIESAASGGAPETNQLAELAAIEDGVRYRSRAIQRLAEHLIPLAQIAGLREEAHALMAEARATERTAQERAEKLLDQLRDAVSGEMVLPVDMSKGVSGALLARVRSLKTRAVQVSENADQLERAYQDRYERP